MSDHMKSEFVQLKAPRFSPVGACPPRGIGIDLAADPATVNDRHLLAEFSRLSEADDDYWAFRRNATRNHAHGLTQYPAMMVPSMQAALLNTVAKIDGSLRSVFDPFCGSGTTLVESMRLGLNYTGRDINPLAVLFCRAKAGPLHGRKLANAAEVVLRWAASDRGRKIEADFPGIDKWFTRSAAIRLSRLRRAIRLESSKWCRVVFWSALAETVRLCSNSRTSTFKLHIRSREDLHTRGVDPVGTFSCVLSRIVSRLQEEATALREAGHLSSNGWYRGRIQIELGDSAKQAQQTETVVHDLLITSPPYGDNKTTVPYGQYSYLPLQWIDLHDIDNRAHMGFLSSTHEIDSQSLGGSQKHALKDAEDLFPPAPSLAKTLLRLATLPPDRAGRVAAFWRDLDSCLDPILRALRPNAYMIWTVGNRKVGGETVPTDAILSELLQARGVHPVTTMSRQIPSKRMATKNNLVTTMRGESILVFRKG